MTKVEDRAFADISRLTASLPARPSAADYENLERLRDLLKALRLAEIRSWAPQDRDKSIAALFDCALAADVSGIKTNEGRVRESLEVLSDMIQTLLDALEPPEIVTVAGPFLVGFLTHPFPPFRSLALEQIRKTASTAELRSNPLVIQSCAMCVGDEDLGVAVKAKDVIAAVARTPEGVQWLFSERELIISRLTQLMKRNDVIKFRVQELAVELSSISEDGLVQCIEAGFLNALLEEFRGNDILAQLNALQLLTTLAETRHGLSFVENQGIVQLLEASLRGYDGPMASFIVPGLMKFFGHITLKDPEGIMARYPGFLETTFACLSSQDLTLVGIALDTIAHVGLTPAGKKAFHKNGLDRQIGTIFRLAETGTSDMRIRALDCMADLISVKGMGVDDSETTEITNSWFRLMQQNPMTKVVTICHQPFPDIRNAGLKLLEAIASQKWGLNCINSSPGLAEYLTDRNTIREKEGKEAKYAVVQALVDHPEAVNIFGHMKAAMFRRYVNEGPFFVAVQAEVAMEGEQ